MISGCSAAEQGVKLLLRPSVGIRDSMARFVKRGISRNPCHVSTYVCTSWETKSIHSVCSSEEEEIHECYVFRRDLDIICQDNWDPQVYVSHLESPIAIPVTYVWLNHVSRKASSLDLKTFRKRESGTSLPLIPLVNIFTIKTTCLIPDQPHLPTIIS